MKKDIFEQISKEVEEFESKEVLVAPKCYFSQKETIDRICAYNNSQFVDGLELDNEGFKKYFYNISHHRCKNATKSIDLDAKDINFIAEEGQSYYPVWFFKKEFKQWAKEKGLGKLLNRVVSDLPVYGSVVIKKLTKYSGNAEDMIVDLRNFYIEQSANSIREASYIIEKHSYTPEELKKKKWDNVEAVLDTYYKNKEKYVEIFERYGEVPEDWLYEGGDSDKYIKSVFIIYPQKKESSGFVLYKNKEDNPPYEECHFEKLSGRWLGRGIVEVLFDTQWRKNEIVNLYSKGLWWTSLKIYQTRDERMKRNLLQNVSNGEVLTARSEITPIVNEERNLSAYVSEDTKWDKLADQMTFSYAPITGERLPSGTPLGSAVLQSQAAQSFFDYIRENVGLFLKGIIWNLIIPQFKEEKYEEHILNLAGATPEELSKINQILINYEYNQKILASLATGRLPSYRQAEAIKAAVSAKIEQEPNRYIRIPQKFYDTLKMSMDIVITGESVDIASKLTTLQTALQLIAGNPMILKDPQSKKVFYKLLDLSGINPADFELTAQEASPEEEMMRAMPQGGSIARPGPRTGTPPIIPTETRV